MSPIIRHLLTASRQSSEAVKAKYSFNIAIQAGLTLLAFIGWVILKNYFFEDFNPFSYWNISGDFWPSIWIIAIPACIYAFFMGQLAWFSDDRYERLSVTSESITFKSIISLSAGIFEELQHRGLYIYFGLIMIYCTNLFFNWIITLAIIVLWFAIFANSKSLIGQIISLATAIGLWFLIRHFTEGNPIYLINGIIFSCYEWLVAKTWLVYVGAGILMAIFLFLTLLLMEDYHITIPEAVIKVIFFSVWTGYALPLGIQALGNMPITPTDADKWVTLLYLGAVMWSNVKFRQGHGYQGPSGVFHSYVFGFYMFYIAFNHGLLYAITIHFLYDLVLFASEHFVQVIKNWKHA